MDKQVQESIQKFENKKDFFEAKLKTRQSFREDQHALERRLAKYRLEENSKGNGEVVDNTNSKDTDQTSVCVNDKKSKDGDSEFVEVGSKNEDQNSEGLNQTELKGMNQVPANGGGHSKLESIVMDIQKEQKRERKRTDSATADREYCEIRVCNDFISAEDEIVKSDVKDVNKSGESGELHTNSKTDKVNGYAVITRDTSSNTKNVSTPVSNSFNNSSRTPANTSKTLHNGHVTGSLTPEPRLKMRGTRLYEKNSRLSASSSDHLDKISSKAGPKSAGHSQTGSQHMRRGSEQRVLVPVIPAPELMSLPADGNLQGFSVQQMVSVFRLLHLPEKLIYRLATSNVDGRRFAMFTDKELDTLGMRNPVIKYFRDRSSQKSRTRKKVFML